MCAVKFTLLGTPTQGKIPTHKTNFLLSLLVDICWLPLHLYYCLKVLLADTQQQAPKVWKKSVGAKDKRQIILPSGFMGWGCTCDDMKQN